MGLSPGLDARVISQPLMPEQLGAVGDGTSHPLSGIFPSFSVASAQFPFLGSSSWQNAEIDYCAIRQQALTAQGGAGLGHAINGELALMPRRAYYMGAGVGVTSTSPPFPHLANDDPFRRTVVRFNGAKVILSDPSLPNCRTFASPARGSDYQTFQGLQIHDAIIDGNNTPGGDAVLYGTYAGHSHTGKGQRANFRHLQFYNPRGVNIPTTDVDTTARQFISIASEHVHTNEGDLQWAPNGGQQTVMEHIGIYNARVDGGDYGLVIVGSYGSGNCGATISSISVDRLTIGYTGKTGTFKDNEWTVFGDGNLVELKRVASHTDNGDGTGTLVLLASTLDDLGVALPAGIGGPVSTNQIVGQPIFQGRHTNVWIDDITIEGGYHDTLVLPNPGTTTGGNNLQVGGIGTGERLRVRNFTGIRCHDDSFEIDSMLDSKCEQCTVIDAQNVAYLPRNFAWPQSKDNKKFGLGGLAHGQVADFTDCVARLRDYNPVAGGGPGVGWVPAYDGVKPAPLFGTIRLQGCRFRSKQTNLRVWGQAIGAVGGFSNFGRLVINDFSAVVRAISDSSPIAAVSLIAIANRNDCLIRLGDIRTEWTGNATPTVTSAQHISVTGWSQVGAPAVTARVIVEGAIEGLRGLSGITQGATGLLELGSHTQITANSGLTSGAATHVDLDGLDWLPGFFGDIAPRMVTIGAGSRITSSSRFNLGILNTAQQNQGVALDFADGTGAGTGTDEVQTLTVTGSGTYTLTFAGQTTGAIANGVAASVVATALTGLSTIGANNVTVTGVDGGPYTITFVNSLGWTNVANITTTNTGVTATIVNATQGAAPLVNRVSMDRRSFISGTLGNGAQGQLSTVLGASVLGPRIAPFTPATTNRQRANIPSGGPVWVYFNNRSATTRLYISGATTATLVEMSGDIGVTWTKLWDGTAAPGPIPAMFTPDLRAGAMVRITYTVGTPTVLEDIIVSA